MKTFLIVGLGNPGDEYNNTRHNTGFKFLDEYAKSKNIKCTQTKFDGKYTSFIEDGNKIILLKPQNFINLSGTVVKKYVNFFNIDIENILIINDDLDIQMGKFKLKANGSSAGHNGLKNIEFCLQTENYKRLKIGISNNKSMNTKDYVLGHYSSEENEILDNVKDLIIDIINDFVKISFDQLMAKYNRKQVLK